jgi:hypothetical protein
MELRGERLNWKEEAERLYQEYGRDWSHMADEMMPLFPGLNHFEVKEKIRRYIRNTPQFKQHKQEDFHRSSIEYKSDGSIISEKFIVVRDGDEMTPEFIIEAHGLKPSAWEVVSYKNNFWNSQVKGGAKQISYQSKLTVKPRKGGIDLAEIDKHFRELERKRFTAPIARQAQGNMLAEINIADLHLGKLCWHGDTPENYDHKIAKDLFYSIIAEIVEQLRRKPIEQVLFVWSNDFFNSDNEEKTTTAGTPQDTDVRNKKMFNIGWEMLIRAIEMLSEVAPVKTFYTPSNHDEETAYHALGVIRAWFRNDPNVTVDLDAYPRKYELYGNTLIGFTHGDKENDKGSKEKASRLASLMPIEAPELWGKSRYREMHAAHLHSEQMIAEINGVIVRRIASPTALDTYHTTHGYVGAVRKVQTLVYDRERGLMQIINTPVA